MIDCGSQRSYICTTAAKRIGVELNNSSSLLINTFVEAQYKQFCEASLSLDLKDGLGVFQLPFLIDETFNLEFSIGYLSEAISNIKNKYNLADTSFDLNGSNTIVLEGLLGVDCLQFLKFSNVKCLGGAAFEICGKVSPYGNVDHFLYAEQISKLF